MSWVEDAECLDDDQLVERVEADVEIGDVKDIPSNDGAEQSDGHGLDGRRGAEEVKVAHGVRHLCVQGVVRIVVERVVVCQKVGVAEAGPCQELRNDGEPVKRDVPKNVMVFSGKGV